MSFIWVHYMKKQEIGPYYPWSKMRHIRCCCFYCSRCHLHKMGQTRLRDLSLYCLNSSQTPILRAASHRLSRLELRMLSPSIFQMSLRKFVKINIKSCALFEHRISIWKTLANQIGQNLNSIDIGHSNVNKSTWTICIFYNVSSMPWLTRFRANNTMWYLISNV